MKKSCWVTIMLSCFLVLGTVAVQAQSESKVFSFGFGLEGGLPLADAKAAYKFAGGLTLRASYHAGPGFITLTSGALAFLPKSGNGEDTKASIQIPVKLGYKYVFYKPFFVMAEAGFSSFKIYYADNNGNLASSNSGGFTYAPTVGVNLNAFELGLRYEATSISGGKVSIVGLRLGFNF